MYTLAAGTQGSASSGQEGASGAMEIQIGRTCQVLDLLTATLNASGPLRNNFRSAVRAAVYE